MTRDVCAICRDPTNDQIQFGDIIRRGDVVVHYFCLLLSSNLQQNGEDHQGIYGFLKKDIFAEIKRASALICVYCKKPGANIGCCHKQCRKAFHLPCAVENSCLFEFYDTYRSFCHIHSAARITNSKNYKTPPHKSDEVCNICKSEMGDYHPVNSLSSPCCGKLSPVWYHKHCMMTMAQASGYFFKCPLCNNTKEFRKEVVKLGIYIPDRDAAWELEPNSFAELNEESDQCYDCKSPHGSKFRDTDIVKCCEYCGNIYHKMCINKKTVDGKSEETPNRRRSGKSDDMPDEIYLCTICEKVDGEEDVSDSDSAITSYEEPNSLLNTHHIRSSDGTSSPLTISNAMLTQWLNQKAINTATNIQGYREISKENVDFNLNEDTTPIKAISINIVCTCTRPELKLNECDDSKSSLQTKLKYNGNDSVLLNVKKEHTNFEESPNRPYLDRTIEEYFYKLESEATTNKSRLVNTTVLSNDFQYACRIDGADQSTSTVSKIMRCAPKTEDEQKTNIQHVSIEKPKINDSKEFSNEYNNKIKSEDLPMQCEVCLAKALEAEILKRSPFKPNKNVTNRIGKTRSPRQRPSHPSPFKQHKISHFFKPEAIGEPSTSSQNKSLQSTFKDKDAEQNVQRNSKKPNSKHRATSNARSSSRIDVKPQQKRRKCSTKYKTFNINDKAILKQKYQPTVRLTDIMLSAAFKLEQTTAKQQRQSFAEDNGAFTPKAKRKRVNFC